MFLLQMRRLKLNIRDICFLWFEEAEPGLKMLHEGRFQLKGATFGGRVPFYRMLIVASFFSFLCLFPFFFRFLYNS